MLVRTCLVERSDSYEEATPEEVGVLWPELSGVGQTEKRSAQLALEQRLCIQPIHPRDVVEGDLFRASGLARCDIGAIAEALGIHLRDHIQHAAVLFDFPLRQQAEVRNLCADKQHR